jgi:E3 ubiquitin-protein ligase HUWE1
MDEINVDAHLTRAVLKHLKNTRVSLRDVEDVDQPLYDSLRWILENDVTEAEMTFAVDFDDVGVHREIALKDGGENIAVTNENKAEYVALYTELRLTEQIKEQLRAFSEGFFALIPAEELRKFTPNELDLLICGMPDFDVDDFVGNLTFRPPLSLEHPTVKLFCEAIRGWKNEELARLLHFMTGSSQVPATGFRAFSEGEWPLRIAPGGTSHRLAHGHTCFNTLDLPDYESVEQMNRQLKLAIEECNTFEMA